MASVEFPLPTAEEAMRIAVNRTAKKSKTIVVSDDQKLAIVALPLAAVVTPDDFGTLKTAIEAITGIQVGVTMLVHGTTRESVAEGQQQVLVTEVHLRTQPVPEE